ncbi:SDR family oxidoreductase [Rhizobium sp. L1K21]|uniref:SDR family oxidoreductase n=1 Tax=Rhizobium sp. L1K21 TaxID=2954933 RepID=UPI0020923F23|nr:SDR family oxidoreductase [Rhizobium sp. L1K21]MCO6186495.1 SDR family oxidoreductase [Rhizobium sp. L1K21]
MTQTPDLKTALVTAGAKRIGKSIALGLASEGFAVAVHAHTSADEAQETVDEIVAAGGRAAVVTADLTDPDAADGLVNKAADALGPLDLVVNNASAFVDDSVHALDKDTWDLHFALHVEAPSRIIGAFSKQLPEGAKGLVVNMIDQRVLKLDPRFYSYVLSKSALWTATRTLAQALAPRIRVNAIGPGPTIPSPRQDPDEFNKQASAVPLGHGPALDEMWRTIAYLYNTPSITGQMIALDGGQHLAWDTPDILESSE